MFNIMNFINFEYLMGWGNRNHKTYNSQHCTYRLQLVTIVFNTINHTPYTLLHYTYDGLNRVTKHNSDIFDYNYRSKIIAANIQPTHINSYHFDEIGSNISFELNDNVTCYTTNLLNQYIEIRNGVTIETVFDLYGNLANDCTFIYTWDGENRLLAIYSGNTLVVSNAYDHQSRRVLKVTPNETRTFLYDGWNLIQETIATSTSTITNHYIWGKDLSGTMQGAGGVGGLLAVIQGRDGSPSRPFFPLYDNNGNITAYVDDTGTIVAEYRYDAFGNTISQSGTMAHVFPHRFSTKYYDAETCLYYYGYRFYSPELMRWLNRDPIGEKGGMNLYGFCWNAPAYQVDLLGLVWNGRYMGEDFYNFYIFGASNGELFRSYHFSGGTGQITIAPRIAPEIIPSGEGACYCVKKNTGKAVVNAIWWGVKPGRPTLADLPNDWEDAFRRAIELGWSVNSSFSKVTMSMAGAEYGTWHENTEFSLLKQLHDHTIKIAEKRAKDYECGKEGLPKISREALVAYIRWDRALETFETNAREGRLEFDRRFGIRVNEAGVFAPGESIQNYHCGDFDRWYKPDIWRDK